MNLINILVELTNIFHRFNHFLGSDGGHLLKLGFEVLLFIFVGYMTTSQYLKMTDKKKNRQLKYLSVAFLTLAFTKIVSFAFSTGVVFGNISRVWIDIVIPPFEHSFEILALFLLGVSVSYPLLRLKIKNLRRKVYAIAIGLTVGISLFLAVFWTSIPLRPYELFVQTPFFTVLAALKILVLGSFVALMGYHFEKAQRAEKYTPVILQALIIYLIPSFLHLFNFAIYQNLNERLYVLAHPFPFIAVIWFFRFSYLKLADKAGLVDKLDLTEKKYEKIKKVTKLKDEFVSIASHELKTPLTSLNLYTTLLAEGQLGAVNEEQKEALHVLKGETQRLTGLVNDLLDLSRIENRKLVLQKKHTNIHHITKEVLFGFQAGKPQLKLKNKVPEETMGHVDKNRIKQVLINLVSNAAKFTPDDGTIEVSARRNKSSLVLSVKDNGRGIPKNKMNQLFQKFYQIDPHLARTEGVQGLGLGLSIVKGIVDAHEGQINVESELNKGTKFTVRLPQNNNNNNN